MNEIMTIICVIVGAVGFFILGFVVSTAIDNRTIAALLVHRNKLLAANKALKAILKDMKAAHPEIVNINIEDGIEAKNKPDFGEW